MSENWQSKIAFIRGVHQYTFRCGQVAEITGVRIARPATKAGELKARPCFSIRFEDGVEDSVVISEAMNPEYWEIF